MSVGETGADAGRTAGWRARKETIAGSRPGLAGNAGSYGEPNGELPKAGRTGELNGRPARAAQDGEAARLRGEGSGPVRKPGRFRAGTSRPQPPDGLAAVLWDMDGTLVDSEKLWEISLRDLARYLGGELSASARVAMVGGSMGHTLEILFDDLGLPKRRAQMAEAGRWLRRRTEELFAQGLSWRPGARAALRMVRATTMSTALVTSTERPLVERALDSIGREYFDITVCGDEVPATKPAPDPYLIAADMLGVHPSRCLVVEDSPTGAAAAEAAGCAVLVVPSEVPVPNGPARVHRDGLIGLTEMELREAWRRVRSGDHWAAKTARSSAPVHDQ